MIPWYLYPGPLVASGERPIAGFLPRVGWGGEFDSYCHLIQCDYLEESSKRPPWHRFLQAVRKFLLNCDPTSCTGRPLFRTWVGLRMKGGFHGMSLLRV